MAAAASHEAHHHANNNGYQYQQQYQPPYQPTQPKLEQHVNYPPPPPARSCFSPQLNRDEFQSYNDENAAIQNQVTLAFH